MKDAKNAAGRGASGLLRRWLAAVLAWSAVGAASAAPAEIPAHWLAYAQQAGMTLQQRLAEENVTTTELHGWMERSAAQPQRQDPIVVRLWIDASGEVERSEFDSLGDAGADAALRALLRGTPLAQPPADMRQPLVLGLSLGDGEADTTGSASKETVSP